MFICSAMAMESRRNLNREEVEDCILQMAQGDKDALARIYEMTHAAVYGFSLSILRNAQDAEDVLQETYLQLYHHAPVYRICLNRLPVNIYRYIRIDNVISAFIGKIYASFYRIIPCKLRH